VLPCEAGGVSDTPTYKILTHPISNISAQILTLITIPVPNIKFYINISKTPQILTNPIHINFTNFHIFAIIYVVCHTMSHNMPKENIFEEFIKLKTSKKTSFTEQDYWFIFNNYPTRNITTKSIAERLKTSPRTIQRIIRDIEKFSGNTLKIQRTKTESNKLIVKNI